MNLEEQAQQTGEIFFFLFNIKFISSCHPIIFSVPNLLYSYSIIAYFLLELGLVQPPL